MTESKTNFSETRSASELLEQFHSLTLRPSRQVTRSRTEAANAFFNKDFLTISDFFGPIGEILIEPSAGKAERNSTVSHFISSNLHRTRKRNIPEPSIAPKKETIAEFFGNIK